jgi:hypothetical protein
MILAGPVPRVARGLAILVGFAVVALNQEVIGTLSSSVQQEGKTVEVDLTPGSDFDRANPEVRQGRNTLGPADPIPEFRDPVFGPT